MRDPKAVNLVTSEKVRADGWQAESRDADGHLISTHAPFDDDAELSEYVRDETTRGHTVTIWPKSN